MRTFDEAVAQFRGAEAGGFGVSEPQAAKVLNEAIKEFAAASEWIRAIIDLGPAVDDQAQYAIPAHVVKVKRLRLGTGSPYSRQSVEVLWDLQAGLLQIAPGYGGIFVAEYNETGTIRYVTLAPTPGAEEAGQPITAYCVITPAEALSGEDPLPFPDDAFRGVQNAAKAIAYDELDENPQQAGYYRDLFNGQAEALRRRANSRVGGGPTKFPVAGHR